MVALVDLARYMYTLLDDIIIYHKFAGLGCMLVTKLISIKSFLVT